MAEFKFVYITTKDRSEAKTIARAVVEQRLAACANIGQSIESVYHWDGKICEDSECSLILKTNEKCLEKLIDAVRELHSYDCPCIVALPIEAGNEPYLSWLKEQTSSR